MANVLRHASGHVHTSPTVTFILFYYSHMNTRIIYFDQHGMKTLCCYPVGRGGGGKYPRLRNPGNQGGWTRKKKSNFVLNKPSDFLKVLVKLCGK